MARRLAAVFKSNEKTQDVANIADPLQSEIVVNEHTELKETATPDEDTELKESSTPDKFSRGHASADVTERVERKSQDGQNTKSNEILFCAR